MKIPADRPGIFVDITVPGLHHACIPAAPCPADQRDRRDRALKLPGVFALVTGKDVLEDRALRRGRKSAFKYYCAAIHKVRFGAAGRRGCGVDRYSRSGRTGQVDYEALPWSMWKAMLPDAPCTMVGNNISVGS